MKLKLMAVLVGLGMLLIVSSCATAPPKPLGPGELRLLSVEVPNKEYIRLHLPFIVNISFEADGEPEIRSACFYFTDDGPHCFKVTEVNYGARGTIKMQISASLPGPLYLKVYTIYIRDGKAQRTNTVGTYFTIIRQ